MSRQKTNAATEATPRPLQDEEIAIMGKIERQLHKLPDACSRARVLNYFCERQGDALLQHIGQEAAAERIVARRDANAAPAFTAPGA